MPKKTNIAGTIILLTLVAGGGGFIAIAFEELISEYIPLTSPTSYFVIGLAFVLIGGWLAKKVKIYV